MIFSLGGSFPTLASFNTFGFASLKKCPGVLSGFQWPLGVQKLTFLLCSYART